MSEDLQVPPLRAKVVLVLEVPNEFPPKQLDLQYAHLKKAVGRWERGESGNVLALMVPEGVKVRAYGIPEETVADLPEIVVRVEKPAEPAQPCRDVLTDKCRKCGAPMTSKDHRAHAGVCRRCQ
jgi:hypothetical protein